MSDLFFAVVSLMIAIGVILIFRKLSDLEEAISGQADRLSQELFTDYGCITEQFRACLSKIDSAKRSISLEIACLATKNNEDIKRMGGKFEEWDLIELEGNDLLITGIETDGDGNVKVHCINNKGKSVTYYRDSPAFKNYARFVKHSVSPFEERQE